MLVYRSIMPLGKRLSSEFHSSPQSFASWRTVHFSDSLPASGFVFLVYQLPENLITK